jgi:hypothetical protein
VNTTKFIKYIVDGKLPLDITGFGNPKVIQAIAFMVVTDENVQVRDLPSKPHRGEVYAG